jgi:hypothetical protein
VEDVNPFSARAAIEGAHRAIEEDLLTRGTKAIGAHGVSQCEQRGTQGLARHAGDDLAADGAAERRADNIACMFESDFHV